jgi:hypothetical protein
LLESRYGSKPEKLDARICFPLYPSKRTSSGRAGMSVGCMSRHVLETESLHEAARQTPEAPPLSDPNVNKRLWGKSDIIGMGSH